MIIFALIFLLLHLAATIPGIGFLWGVDAWSYFSFPIAIMIGAIGLSGIIPATNNIHIDLFERYSGLFNKIPIPVVVIACGLLFFLFSQELPLLGDGFLRIRNAESGTYIVSPEPMDTFLHIFFFSLLNKSVGLGAKEIYAYLSIFSGMAAIGGALHYIRKIFTESKRGFVFAAFFLCGSVQLFFGYVESYSIMAALVILFLFSAWDMLLEDKFKIAPAFFMFLPMIFHPLSVVFLPAGIYAYYITIQKMPKRFFYTIYVLLVGIFAMILLGTAFAYIGFGFEKLFDLFGTGSHILPLAGDYGIFSLLHLLDVINEIFLTTPAIIGIPLLFKHFTRIKNKPVFVFLTISVFFSFVFMLIFHTKLGFARDWDLTAVFAFPMTLLIIFLITKSDKRKEKKYTAMIIVLVSLIHTVPWILVNSSESLSFARASDMADTKHWTNSSRARLYDEISYYLFDNAKAKASLKPLYKSYELEKNERILYKIAVIYHGLGNNDSAAAVFKRLSGRGYKESKVTQMLGTLYFEEADFARSAMQWKKLAEIDSSKKLMALKNAGKCHMQMQQYDLAAEYFEKALGLGREDAEALRSLAETFYYAGKDAKAMEIWKKLIKQNPEDPVNYYNLALSQTAAGLFDKALKSIDRAAQRGFDRYTLDRLRQEINNFAGD